MQIAAHSRGREKKGPNSIWWRTTGRGEAAAARSLSPVFEAMGWPFTSLRFAAPHTYCGFAAICVPTRGFPEASGKALSALTRVDFVPMVKPLFGPQWHAFLVYWGKLVGNELSQQVFGTNILPLACCHRQVVAKLMSGHSG